MFIFSKKIFFVRYAHIDGGLSFKNIQKLNQGKGCRNLVLVESRHICIFVSYEKPNIFFVILISFIYKPEGLFITFYQIIDPYSDALNLSKTIWGTQGPCVCCTIEYSFLKRNLYGFVQNFNITIFVRFNTNLMIELKSEFEQVIHIKVGD